MKGYNLFETQDYNKRLQKVLAGGVHYNFRLLWERDPIQFVKGKGSRLWDADGNEYLDFYAKFGAMIVGHNNERYNELLKNCIDRVLAVDHCKIDAEVCELLHLYIPSAEMVRFGLSGTETVQNAIRLARAYTGKERFIRFEGHYHGNADNILGGKVIDPTFPVPTEFEEDSRGTRGRAKGILESQSFLLPWNNSSILEDIINQHGHEIAAIITEPICINGGGIMPQPGYLEKMRSLCTDNNIILIFDEIITGFRLGLSGAQGMLNVVPDITTLGKAVAGGGIPVSVLAGKRELMKLYENKEVVQTGTFNGYPLGLAAIKASIEILSENDGENYKSMTHFASILAETLKEQALDIGLTLTIQGPPSCFYYHCKDRELETVTDWDNKTQMKELIIRNALLEYGIYNAPLSRFYLNVMLNDDDVTFFQNRLPYALQKAKSDIDKLG